MFTIIQASYLIYAVIVRPFDETKDNIIEIISESAFTFICLSMAICNQESRWFKGLDQIMIYSLMMVGMMISIVTFIDFMIGCIRKRREKKQKKYLENVEEEEKGASDNEQCNNNHNSQEEHSKMERSL